MNWNFLISFGIALVVYIGVVLLIAFLKKRKKKKKDATKNDEVKKD